MKHTPSPLWAALLSLWMLAAPAAAAQQGNVVQRPTAPQNLPTAPEQRTPPRQTRPAPSQPTAQYDDEDEVVRITTNLVQVDAVVVDKDGRQVTDLKPEDFVVYENDKAQKITNFSYVSTAADAAPPVSSPTARPSKRDGVAASVVPPARLRPEHVRRTFVFVVDDFTLSFDTMNFARQALRKFVDEQMQPGDLVAVVRTTRGTAALQQFTSDKRKLYAAINSLRWYPIGAGGLTAFDPINASTDNEPASLVGSAEGGIDAARTGRKDIERERKEVFSRSQIKALGDIVRGLRELPGRKSVLLLSHGFTLIDFGGVSSGQTIDIGSQVLEAVRRLADQANRASVVIHTMDIRGLEPDFSAADSTGSPLGGAYNPSQVYNAQTGSLAEKHRAILATQDGLKYLADQTGGLTVRNTNDFTGGIRRVVEDQQGYYLIGFRPDSEAFDPVKGRAQFRKLKVEVRRPGLRVRSRAGFYGVADAGARHVAKTRAEQIRTAVLSPFTSGDIDVRLSALFGNEPAGGSFMRSVLHVDARSLSFAQEPDGWRKATFDIVAVTFRGDAYGDDRVVDQVDGTETLRVKEDAYERLLKSGLEYVLNVPVKHPGAYQLRVAVRDTATERVGTASQFLEVPDLSKDALALSGVLAQGGGQEAQAGVNASATSGAQQQSPSDPQAGPAVRRFRRGTTMDYFYQIYNARLDASGRPQLQTQVRLFRDGKEVYMGRAQTFDASGQADLKRLSAGGRLQLGTQLPPGEYVLQVVVTDTLAKGKQQTATQWTDFEIVQ